MVVDIVLHRYVVNELRWNYLLTFMEAIYFVRDKEKERERARERDGKGRPQKKHGLNLIGQVFVTYINFMAKSVEIHKMQPKLMRVLDLVLRIRIWDRLQKMISSTMAKVIAMSTIVRVYFFAFNIFALNFFSI